MRYLPIILVLLVGLIVTDTYIFGGMYRRDIWNEIKKDAFELKSEIFGRH